MIYFILLTSFIVAIDSFVCGFSLSLLKTRKSFIVLGITVTVFLMCVIANYSTLLLEPFFTEKTAGLGGIILVVVGFFNVLKKDSDSRQLKNTYIQILISGFAVGLDGAFANLSFCLMGYSSFAIPVLIAVVHGVMIFLGVTIANIPIIKKFKKYDFIAPLILIALGVYKVAGVFI